MGPLHEFIATFCACSLDEEISEGVSIIIADWSRRTETEVGAFLFIIKRKKLMSDDLN